MVKRKVFLSEKHKRAHVCADGNDPEKRNILMVQHAELSIVGPMPLST